MDKGRYLWYYVVNDNFVSDTMTKTKSKKILKIILITLLVLAILIATVPTAVFFIRGSERGVELPNGFVDEINANAFDNTADVRIMSSNLLVNYESWGGTPAKPRAKQYTALLEAYKPDVIGVQEMSDEWYCLLRNNLPQGYKMLFPFTTGVFVRMTAVIYNSNTLKLIDSGNFKYEQGDNPRLRRLVWGVFEVKETGERFAVTSTHFDLLRDGMEDELTAVMEEQTKELINFDNEAVEKYNCPVISVGDYNTMEDTPNTKPIDIPAIYNTLCESLTDAKFNCENRVCGTEQDWDYPSYDHIFIKGDAAAETFALLSYKALSNMSDHYPVFADIKLNE